MQGLPASFRPCFTWNAFQVTSRNRVRTLFATSSHSMERRGEKRANRLHHYENVESVTAQMDGLTYARLIYRLRRDVVYRGLNRSSFQYRSGNEHRIKEPLLTAQKRPQDKTAGQEPRQMLTPPDGGVKTTSSPTSKGLDDRMMRPVNRFSRISLPARPTAQTTHPSDCQHRVDCATGCNSVTRASSHASEPGVISTELTPRWTGHSVTMPSTRSPQSDSFPCLTGLTRQMLKDVSSWGLKADFA